MYAVCHNYIFILLFQMLAYIQLQNSTLPEQAEFQPGVQQLKTKSAQQRYNFTNFTNATIYIYIYIYNT